MIMIVNANSTACRIYQYNKQQGELTVLTEILHPENKLKNSELTSDRPGHYQGGESARGAYSPPMDTKDVHINNFAREIAQALNHLRTDHQYDKLIIISPAHMNGLLSQHLNKNVKNLVINTFSKDLVHVKEKELIDFLKNNAAYPQ